MTSEDMMLRVAVLGATGRMGGTLIRLISADEKLALSGALTEPGDHLIGEDAGSVLAAAHLDVALTDRADVALRNADVAIDFTLPAATSANIRACQQAGAGLVMGTTGLDDEHLGELRSAAEVIPIVYGRNMSVGVNVLTELARMATKALGGDFDIEIIDTHHRNKVDAPSGTAMQLGEAIAASRGARLADCAVFSHHEAPGPRPAGTIGFSAIRAGSIVGDHSIMFAADEEVLELRHRAIDRAVFARGALRAARWVNGRAAGLYEMQDVLGIRV
jgi:4-hydroxy-tetrahydrodipicolinate reductase